MRVLLTVLITAFLAPVADASQTFRKTLHVGSVPVHWQTKPVPDQSLIYVQIRVDGRELTVETDSVCSGNAWHGDLVVRVNTCGNGAAPVRVAAVRLGDTPRRKTVRLRVTVG
jgi:hypothetical protein